MALRTIGRYIQGSMAGVGCSFVIFGVAGSTLGRGAGISVGMAINTIDRQVRARERKCTFVVIKRIVRIAGGVAGQTSGIFIDIPVYPIVPDIGFRIGVTNGAGIRLVIAAV